MGVGAFAVVTRRLVALSLAVAGLAWFAQDANAHPLHTTLTEVSLTASGEVEIRLRAFVDDFSAAVAGMRESPRPPFAAPGDSATARYLAGRLTLTDASGRATRLLTTGVRREGDVVWVTLRAPGLRSLADARLTNSVLFERYDDQVNIVQTSAGARRRTLLFTKRDGRAAKPLDG
jgi:hypothetical protein